jgi:TonB-dependent receptor
VSGNIGIRYTDTQRSSFGAIRRASGAIDPLSYGTDFADWLPSAVVKFELSQNLQVRFGAAKVLGLPDTIDLSPNLQLNRLSPYNGSAGNPSLKPIRADQYDASIEWYFAQGSALTVGAFYKDVKTFIYSKAAYEIPPGEVAPDPLGQGWLVTRPYNGSGGKVKGVEVLFQTPFYFLPAPLDGFGVVANLSYIDSSTTLLDRKGPRFRCKVCRRSTTTWSAISRSGALARASPTTIAAAISTAWVRVQRQSTSHRTARSMLRCATNSAR